MKRIYLDVIFAIALFVLLDACKPGRQVQKSTPPEKKIKDTLETVQLDVRPLDSVVVIQAHRLLKDTVSIIGVGDIMMGTNFPDPSYLPPDNGNHLLADVQHILKNADVTFGNLEGVVLDSGGTQKECANPKLCYLFRTPESFVRHLVDAGFDVMSLANNHAGDFGDMGRTNTMHTLDSAGIEHAGLLEQPYTIFKREGMFYGFTAFSPNIGTIDINDTDNARKIVQHLDSITDIVIVSFHGGAEGKKHQHVTREREYYFGENRGNIYAFSHDLIDAGADVVFGHGPHVTRAIEIYNHRFIAYSLGNFCTYARFNLRGPNGIAPIIKVFTSSSGKFLTAKIIPVIQNGEGGPDIDKSKRAIKVIRQLTREDFPELKINIDEAGIINYIE